VVTLLLGRDAVCSAGGWLTETKKNDSIEVLEHYYSYVGKFLTVGKLAKNKRTEHNGQRVAQHPPPTSSED
jgi:hypothetical protein